MKRTIIVVAVIVLTALSITAFTQRVKEAETLFHRGVHFEEVRGELKEAIAIYEKLIKEFADVRPVVAKAQLHIGLCYEKLGLKQAQDAFQRVIDHYPEQTEAVKTAKEKLGRLLQAEGVMERGDTEFKIRKLWEGADVNITGSVSPDGKYISYTDLTSGDLAVRELATGQRRRLTTNPVSSAWTDSSVFSPDGKQIAFAWSVWETELRIIGLDGTNLRTLAQSRYIQPLGWTPDGRHILAIDSNSAETYRIVLVAAADGAIRPLKTLGAQTPLSWMGFSPDGRNIAYDLPQREGSNDRDIFLLAADGTREIRLIEHPSNDFVLGWMPDSKHLLFASNRTGSIGVWIIQVADGQAQGKPELLKQDIGWIRSLGITNNGSFFYGNMTQMTHAVNLAGLDPKTFAVVSAPEPLDAALSVDCSSPDWSPNGKFLAYRASQLSGSASAARVSISIRSVETGEDRDLSPSMKSFYLIKWSPEGRSLLLVGANDKNQFGLHIADVQTGQITATVPDGYWGSWSPNGKEIFYAKNDASTKSRPLVVRNIESGEDKVLIQGFVGLCVAVSPEGGQLAFSTLSGENSELTTLNILSLKEGKTREIFKLKNPEDFGAIAWSRDGKRLIFVRRNFKKNKHEVWQIPLDGGEPRALGLFTTATSTISVHPDGKRIAFGVGQPRAEIWVKENFLK